MRILWLNHGIFPEVSKSLGLPCGKGGSWLWNLFTQLRDTEPSLEFCMLSIGYHPFGEIVGDKVRYCYFGQKGKFYYPQARIPRKIQEQVKEKIRQFNPDVIHVHGTEYYLGCMDDDVYCDKPVVVSIQGVLSECHIHYTGSLSPRETWWTKYNLRLLKYRSTLFRDQTFWRECRAEQEQRIFKQQHYFIGRTEWDKNCLMFYNPQAHYFIGNETLRDVFYRVRRDSTSVARHSIFCGAATSYPLKGAHWLIRAIAALKDEYPDIKLRIAASTWSLDKNRSFWNKLRDDSYSRYLRRLIKDLGVQEQIVPLPLLDAETVAEELRRAEIFVLPSLCENSSNSIGEAMLVGTPIISTFSGGTPDIINNGIEGKLVQPSDPHALAGAIRRWFIHPEEAEACIEPARETALHRHDRADNAKKMLEIYKSIIELHAKIGK